jgi:hypothetical protein
MEGRQSKTGDRDAAAKGALIVAEWDRLGRVAVGESELAEIQQSVARELSPAAIARVLADEGAELRHPEVIEFDARWRAAKIEKEASKFKGLEGLVSGKPLSLKQAGAGIKRFEIRRQRFEKTSDQPALRRLRSMAIEARQAAELAARDPSVDQRLGREQAEVAQWFAVWLQTPNLFEDWLELRRRSPQFRDDFLSEI